MEFQLIPFVLTKVFHTSNSMLGSRSMPRILLSLLMLHDMRYKGPRLSEIIRNIYHRDPLNGDIYIYMSRDRRTIRLFQYKHHVYDLHERTFSNEYRFKKVVLREGVPTYKMDWKTVMIVLESPVIKQIRA